MFDTMLKVIPMAGVLAVLLAVFMKFNKKSQPALTWTLYAEK